MNIYIICPVSDVAHEFEEGIEAQVILLEGQGHTVYYPPRDTKDDNQSSLYICQQNRMAMENSDKVYFAWDGNSHGCVFDLGVAFALRKPIRSMKGFTPVERTPLLEVVSDWEKICAD